MDKGTASHAHPCTPPCHRDARHRAPLPKSGATELILGQMTPFFLHHSLQVTYFMVHLSLSYSSQPQAAAALSYTCQSHFPSSPHMPLPNLALHPALLTLETMWNEPPRSLPQALMAGGTQLHGSYHPPSCPLPHIGPHVPPCMAHPKCECQNPRLRIWNLS